MNAKQFLILLNKANFLQKEDFQALVRLHETFPYFALPKILTAKYEMEKTKGASQELLHWASVQSPDRVRLKQLIEQEIDFLPPPPPPAEGSETEEDIPGIEPTKEPEDPSQKHENPDLTIKTREEILKRLEDNLNRFKKSPEQKEETDQEPPDKDATPEDLIATIKKKEKKIIVDARKREQNDLIKAFSKKSIKLGGIPETQDDADLTDLSKNSTTFNDKIISEAFAKLLIKQNKKDQAVEIYRKLILKFPNKTAYFAALIKELED